MSFIRIFPLQDSDGAPADNFGSGQPARCVAQGRFGAREYYLNISEFAAFEECPLYLISKTETDALVNGIRLRLCSGEILVIPDDPGEPENSFLNLLTRTANGEVVEMEYSRYLRDLEKDKLI